MTAYSIFSNIKQSVSYLDAHSADPTLSKCVVPGVQIRYAASRSCTPVPNDPERMDAFMEEMLNVAKSGCVLWDPKLRDNLRRNIEKIADFANPLFCAPSNCNYVPAHKKLWLQTDTKKLMCREEIASDDCCDDKSVWIEISGGNVVGAPSFHFIGDSDQTPADGALEWYQPDTGKFLTKQTQGTNCFWAEE